MKKYIDEDDRIVTEKKKEKPKSNNSNEKVDNLLKEHGLSKDARILME